MIPVLTYNDDRTVDITLDDGRRIHLRPPNITEWRKIRDAYLAADSGLAQLREDWERDHPDDPGAHLAGEYTWSDQNPYGTAFALIIDTLSDSPIDSDRLPVWATDPRLYPSLYQFWRTIPIGRDDTPARPLAAAAPEESPPFDPVAAGLTPTVPTSPVSGKPLPRVVQDAIGTGQIRG